MCFSFSIMEFGKLWDDDQRTSVFGEQYDEYKGLMTLRKEKISTR